MALEGLPRFQAVASIAPLTIEGHLWACRSLLSVWVPSRAESWVPRSPELSQQPHALLFGRASIAPLTIEGHLWACRSLLSIWVQPLMLRVESSALQSSVISSLQLLVGRASFAPLNIEGHLWGRSFLGVWVPSHVESWAFRSPELGDRLPLYLSSVSAELGGC